MEAVPGASKELIVESPTHDQEVKLLENAKKKSRDVWKCYLCNLEERYDYKGNNPPFAKHLTFSEECYIMKDPFSPPNKGELLVLGGDCSLCENPVCMQCSLFYAQRFCKTCALKNITHFPKKLKEKIPSMNKEDEEDF